MNSFLETALWPIIYVIENYFFFLFSIVKIHSISIILTSLTISVVLIPVLSKARKYEDKINKKINNINKELNKISIEIKGEERFRQIEEIYLKNNFHPIQNINKGLSLFVLLPILLSAYLFFLNNNDIFEVYFIGFKLSEPDGAILGYNILPILIFLINFIDANLRFDKKDSAKNTYLIISFVICVLIYSMPSCMTLYWATSSIFTLVFNLFFGLPKQT